MIKLIGLEISKLLHRKKTYVVIGAFVALMILLSYSCYREEKNMKKMMSPENQISNMQESINYRKQDIERMKKDIDKAKTDDDKNKINNNISSAQTEITEMENSIEQLKSDSNKNISWKETLQKQIDSEEKSLDDITDSSSINYVKQQIENDKYMLKNNIKPVPDYTFNAFNFITKVMEALGTIFLAVGIAVFVSDMISGECTPPTLKLLLTQPVSRGKVVFSKYISSILSSIIFVAVIELIFFIIIGLIFGFGDPNYPILIGTKYKFDMSQLVNNAHPLIAIGGTGVYVAAWKFMAELIALQSVFIIACTSFTFLISTIFRSSMVSMGTGIVIIIVSSIVLEIMRTSRIIPYIFLAYGDVGSVLNSKIVMNFNNPNLTVSLFLIVMSAWTLICYTVSHVLFVKRDILI